MAKSNFIYIDPSIVLGEKSDVAAALVSNDEPIRIYSPSYSLPQQTAARFGLETINGIDPLQLRNFIHFFSQASGIPYQKYSVTVPPFDNAELSLVNQGYPINAPLMGLLNVKYIVSSFEVDSPGLTFQNEESGQYIYINQAFRPRAWVQPRQEEFDQYSNAVSIRKTSPNHINLEGTGPGTLVLSAMVYPGWQVKVDGKTSDLLTIHQLLRGVNLPPGKHQVDFSYRPDLLYISLACAVFGWMWMIHQFLISGSGF